MKYALKTALAKANPPDYEVNNMTELLKNDA